MVNGKSIRYYLVVARDSLQNQAQRYYFFLIRQNEIIKKHHIPNIFPIIIIIIVESIKDDG